MSLQAMPAGCARWFGRRAKAIPRIPGPVPDFFYSPVRQPARHTSASDSVQVFVFDQGPLPARFTDLSLRPVNVFFGGFSERFTLAFFC